MNRLEVTTQAREPCAARPSRVSSHLVEAYASMSESTNEKSHLPAFHMRGRSIGAGGRLGSSESKVRGRRIEAAMRFCAGGRPNLPSAPHYRHSHGTVAYGHLDLLVRIQKRRRLCRNRSDWQSTRQIEGVASPQRYLEEYPLRSTFFVLSSMTTKMFPPLKLVLVITCHSTGPNRIQRRSFVTLTGSSQGHPCCPAAS